MDMTVHTPAQEDATGVSASQAQHDLPWRLKSLDLVDGGAVLPVDDARRRFRFDEDIDVDYDSDGGDTVRYVGDGKNVYRLALGEGAESSILPESHEAVKAECLGVCDPSTYQQIMEQEGFDAVLDYIDGQHRNAIGYDPETGFMYPHRAPATEDTEFYGNSQAQQAVGKVMEERRPETRK